MTTALQRFHLAQARGRAGFEAALAEIRAGEKRSHWIWYIFPQLSGLGSSAMARSYGLAGAGEAAAYLRDPVLRANLLGITAAAAEHARRGVPIERLMGSGIDAQKLVSSMTLFGYLARNLHAAEGLAEYEELARLADELLAIAAAQGYPACSYTRAQLGLSSAR